MRRPIANAYVQRARRAGQLYHFDAPGMFDGTACGEEEKRQLKELSEEVYKQFMSIWLEEGPDEVFERAAAEYNRLVVLQE